jgi:hypothetical protein
MRDTARDRIARRQHGQDPLLPVTDVSISGTQLCLNRFKYYHDDAMVIS